MKLALSRQVVDNNRVKFSSNEHHNSQFNDYKRAKNDM